MKRARRTGEPPLAMLERYSTLARSRSRRARRIRAQEPPAELVTLAGELLRGEHADPCPLAIGWGGRDDGVQAHQRPVACNVQTANWFYAVR